MAWPRRTLTIYDRESGEWYFDNILSIVSLLFLIITVGIHNKSNDFFLTSLLGSLCGIAGMIVAITGIVNGVRNSRSQRTLVGIGALIMNATVTFANMYIFLVDALHLFS